MINGLITCKPQNTPRVGDVKFFVLEQRQGKNGKPWNKIRNPQQGQQGQLFNILEVAKTNYTDDRGNVSFNLTLEPTQGQPQPMQFAHNGPQTHQEARQQAFEKPVAKDTPRQHLMRAANLYALCMDAVDKVIVPHFDARSTDGMPDETWRAAVSTLFIDAQRAGMVDQMPATPMKASNEASMPETEQQGEYTPFEPREEEPF